MLEEDLVCVPKETGKINFSFTVKQTDNLENNCEFQVGGHPVIFTPDNEMLSDLSKPNPQPHTVMTAFGAKLVTDAAAAQIKLEITEPDKRKKRAVISFESTEAVVKTEVACPEGAQTVDGVCGKRHYAACYTIIIELSSEFIQFSRE